MAPGSVSPRELDLPDAWLVEEAFPDVGSSRDEGAAIAPRGGPVASKDGNLGRRCAHRALAPTPDRWLTTRGNCAIVDTSLPRRSSTPASPSIVFTARRPTDSAPPGPAGVLPGPCDPALRMLGFALRPRALSACRKGSAPEPSPMSRDVRPQDGIRGCHNCYVPFWTRGPNIWTACCAACFCRIVPPVDQDRRPGPTTRIPISTSESAPDPTGEAIERSRR